MGRNRAWITLVALLTVSPAMAGCLGSAQATAMQQQDVAEAQASQWAGNPRMIEAVGVEGTFVGAFGDWRASGDPDASYWDRAEDDPDVGDGRAKLWVYRFISEDDPGTVLTVVVDEQGEVVHEDRSDASGERAIGEWNVDSDEAADTAMDANDGLRKGTESEHYGLVFHLDTDDDHDNPVWTIVGGGGDASGGGGGVVEIDAVTGEVLSSHGGYGSFPDWQR